MSTLLICLLLASNNPLQPYQWKNRVLLIFGPEEKVEEQLKIWNVSNEGMKDRQLVKFILSENYTRNPEGQSLSEEEKQYLVDNYHDGSVYQVVLIGKDGGQKLTQNDFLSTKKLFKVIDAMPMQKQEMKDDGKP